MTFIAPPEEEVVRPTRRWRFRPWMLVLGIFVVILIAAFPLLRGGVQVGLQARTLKVVAEDARARLEKGDLAGAQMDVNQALVLLPEIRASLRRTGVWRFMPFVGVHIRALEDITEASQTTLASVQDILHVATTLQDAVAATVDAGDSLDPKVAPHRSFQDLSPEEKRSILLKLRNLLPELKIAREKMTIALNEWDKVNSQSLAGPVQNLLRPLVRKLHVYQTALDQGIVLTETFLPLSGLSSPKTYLVLLQNADELRPTGGFIGTIGMLILDAGEIKALAFQDVYALDGAVQDTWKDQPPEILTRELGVKAWFLRDSNWSPDFPQSSQRLLDVYAREAALANVTSTSFDGVIALQPKLFERLLQISGPLQVAGKTFHAENFFDQLEYDVEQGFLKDGTPVKQRKEIVSQVGAALMTALVNQPSSRWPEIMDQAVISLQQKDVLLYAHAPDIQRVWDAYGWTGRTKASAQDYLWVIDANLAALKTDGVMDKQVHYQLDARDPSRAVAKVTLTYKNTNRSFSWRYTRYRDYVRIYVPEGSELISSTGAMAGDKTRTGGIVVPGTVDVMRDLGKTVFGAFWAIEPGETRSLSFTYRLPAGMITPIQGTNAYELLVQRQPGAVSRLTLDLNFGKNIMTASPPEAQKDFGDARYQTSQSLQADELVHVRFASP